MNVFNGQINENGVIVLANNMRFFKLLVKNIPETINGCTLFVVNEVRIGDKTKQIEQVLMNSIIQNYVVISSQEINSKFKKDVIDNEFVQSYSMSMNILSNWYIFKYINGVQRLLFIDDDVLLRTGFQKLFEQNHNMFKYLRLSAGGVDFYKQSKNMQSYFEQFFRIFDIKFSEQYWRQRYLKRYISSGQWYSIKSLFDVVRYQSKLKQFFLCKVFFDLWNKRKSHTSYFFDERFLMFYFQNNLNDDLKRYVYIIINGPEKFVEYKEIKRLFKHKEYAIIHNATKSRKNEIYDILIEQKLIGDFE